MAGNPFPLDKPELLEAYRKMRTIREFEERLHVDFGRGDIPGFVHLYAGEEAAGVGIISQLGDGDRIASTHRGHGHCIAKGVDPVAMMKEIYGKKGGSCEGKGGSMHIADVSKGMMGANGILGAGAPLACGAALAAKYRKKGEVAISFVGDGASNQGTFLESLNLAAVWNLPVVFLVINNLYGMGTSVDRASAETDLFKRAGSYRMTGERVDGDDLEGMEAATSRLLKRAREERRPAVLEAVTYRYRGHSVADAGLAYRSKEEIEEHRREDPLVRTRELLEARGVPVEGFASMEAEVEAEVETAVAFAEADEPPSVDRLAAGVYTPGSEEQFERICPGSPFGEAELVFAGGLGE